MRVVKTPPPPLPVPSGSKTTTTTTVPKAPSGTIIPQFTTQTTVPQPLVGQPPVTTPPAAKTTAPTLTQKKGAVPLPVPSPVPVQENVPATGRAGMGIPSVKTPPGYTTSPDLYEARTKLGQATIDALREGVPKEEVAGVVSGEDKKLPGGWRGALAKIIDFDIVPGRGEFKPSSLVLGPLTAVDTGRRALVSGFQESVELGKDIIQGKQVYKPTDYIPTHKQTGLPIAKVGDPVIDNWKQIINTPIPDIEKINTYEEAQKAQDKIVKDTATTTSGSFKDLVRQTENITTGFGDIPYVQTGNKWVDRAIGFFGDVVLDPTTYVSGPGALAKEPLEAATTAGARRAAVELAERTIVDTSAELATRVAAREAAEAAAKQAADYVDNLAAAATESAVKTPIIANRIPELTGVIREAEQRAALAAEKAAAAQAAEAAARAAANTAKATDLVAAREGLKAAEKTVTKAQRQAPRRVYGAGARETLANTVRGIREQALTTAADASVSAAERTAAATAARVLSDDLISNIATKGYAEIRGEAAQLLGVRSGLRIGLPGYGKYTIPLTAPFVEAIGRGVAGRRLWFVNTPKGAAILNRFMGAPEGGIIGDATQLEMRSALSRGTVKGAEAVDYVGLLALDKAYRGQLNLIRKEGVAIINALRKDYPGFKATVRKIAPYLQTPESGWSAKGLRALNADERAIYDAFKEITDSTFAQADRAARSLGGRGLTKLDDYFPHVQSAAALEWAARNRRLADKLADELGVDTMTLLSGNYLNRKLIPGKTWFGYELEPADIAGGVERLNEIARQYGKLKFDFFTTNAGEALAKYLDNHARFMAYTSALKSLPTPLGGGTGRGVPTYFDTRFIPGDISRALTARIAADEAVDVTALAARVARNTRDLPAIASSLDSVEARIVNLMRPDKLVNWSPDKLVQVRGLINLLGERLTRDTVVKREIASLVSELDNQIIETTRLIDAGVIDPAVGGMLLDEAEHMAISLVDDIGKVKTQFAGTAVERWAGASELAKLGFESINPESIPNIYARREVAAMLQNLKQLDDTKFAKIADALLKDLTTMSKGYLTGSIGFHVRNVLGGIFIMTAAGGRLDNLLEAARVYRKLESNLKKGISYIDTIKTLPPSQRELATVVSGLSGATGFGQFGEIAQAAGAGKTGITGRTATGLTPFAGRRVPFGGGRVIPGMQIPIAGRASAALYTPLRYLRDKGSAIEQVMRFSLLYDGIKQGLNPLEAANRVNKFLVDYANPTKFDRQMRSVYTFWTWMSRNLPLQVENMWMAPGAYQKYMSFRRNMQDEDGESPFLPEYLKEMGAFKIPFGENIYARPDLGFPGASAPNILQQAAGGDVYEVLSGLTPALRVPLELEINKQLFSGAPLRSEFKSDKENAQAVRTYLYSQLLSPAGLAGRYLSAIPGDEPKWLQTLTGSKLDRELNTTLSLIGAPGFKLRSIEERNEILRRYYFLQEKKNRAIQNNQPPEE